MKKAIKKTVKVKKPKYTIDMTNAVNMEDIAGNFVGQKILNGMKILYLRILCQRIVQQS